MTDAIIVERFELGHFMTNSFLIYRSGQRQCIVIDPGFCPEPLIRTINDRQLSVGNILLTHGHIDHIAGIQTIREHWPTARIGIHAEEQAFLTDPMLNLSGMFGPALTVPPADWAIEENQKLQLAGIDIQPIHIPGHSPGSLAYYIPAIDTAFVGDTLFARSLGRTDFPTSNPELLIPAIREKLCSLPEHTIVQPGHGPQTTIGQEMALNPFINA